MDEDEEYAENRDELLDRFRTSLSLPMAERYFDEDDLIEIFDYAGDLNDDYLRIEALLCGARFYPDSEELLVRRGIFFSQYSDEARAQFLSHTPTQGNLILSILKLRNNPPADEEAKSALESLLESHDNLSDEEVIQYVDLCSSLGQYEWLKDNLDSLRKRSQYLNVLIYEMGVIAEMNRDYAFAAQMLEELTDLEPFNSYYWMLLARQYAQLDDTDKALSAIDYSLAINPQAYGSMLIKARLLYSMHKPLDEVLSLTRKAIAESDNDPECVKFLAQIYHNEGQDDMAVQVILDALNLDKDTDAEDAEESVLAERQRIFEYIPELLAYHPDNLPELLDRFYAANEDNSQMMWMSWAQQLSMQGHSDTAREVISCYERNSGMEIPSVFNIEDAFIGKDFDRSISSIQDYMSKIEGAEADFPQVLTMHIISLVKSGQTSRALSLCDFISQNIFMQAYSNIGSRLEYLGMLQIANEIRSLLQQDMPTSFWATYDPLDLWENNDAADV